MGEFGNTGAMCRSDQPELPQHRFSTSDVKRLTRMWVAIRLRFAVNLFTRQGHAHGDVRDGEFGSGRDWRPHELSTEGPLLAEKLRTDCSAANGRDGVDLCRCVKRLPCVTLGEQNLRQSKAPQEARETREGLSQEKVYESCWTFFWTFLPFSTTRKGARLWGLSSGRVQL